MKREHAVVLGLLMVLLIAVGLVIWSGQRPDTPASPVADRDPPVAGRALRLEEIASTCERTAAPVAFVQPGGPSGGECTVQVGLTREPFWSIPLVERFLQPELRRLTVRLDGCDSGSVQIGDTREDLRPGGEMAIAIQADGVSLTFRSSSGCRLITDVAP